MKVYEMEEYIDIFYGDYHGAKTRFALSVGVKPQQVTKWIKLGWTVTLKDSKPRLNSPKNDLPEIKLVKNEFNIENQDRFPLYHHYQGKEHPQAAYITLNASTGAVDVDVENRCGGITEEVTNGVVLRFPCNPKISSSTINDFINDHLMTFQQLLSIYKTTVIDGETIGAFINGFENSTDIMALTHLINTNIESDEVLITDVEDVDIESEIFNTPIEDEKDLDLRIKMFCLTNETLFTESELKVHVLKQLLVNLKLKKNNPNLDIGNVSLNPIENK